MAISINSNISSLRAQKALGQSSDKLNKVYEALSSGSRINQASDDAAGLAIRESLKVNSGESGAHSGNWC